MANDSLDRARKEINEIDKEMAALFVRRMKAAEAVAEYKKQRGLAILDEARENEVIQRNSAFVEEDVIREYYVNFLRDTMAVSRAYQSRLMEGMKVAFSGTEGAFAHIAACKLYPTAKKVAFGDFSEAYRAVERGECDVAVLPVENSYNGEVGQVTDLMFSGSLYVNGMFDLPITQDLLAKEGVGIDEIREVVSHPQAFGQCRSYIERHGFTRHEFANTALAARWVAENPDRTVAAIGSREAADIFGLKVIDHDINESRSNSTRFAIFSRTANKRIEKDGGVHSILLFTVRNEAGALAQAVDVIGKYGFNMRTLRSRPMKELLWEYYFYVEVEGNVQSETGASLLESLGEFCDRLKFAGTYIKL
ncbi:MAG: chorismate mutase [Clostridia bacterium]|nr:chorismate mutase [Clostridia bacterium]